VVDQAAGQRGVHRRRIPGRDARDRARAPVRDPLADLLDPADRALGAGHEPAGGHDIHEDRFKFDYFPTWVWTIVYAGVPLALPYLVWRQNQNADAEPAADPRLRPVRVLSAILGAGLLAGAIALFVAPVELGKHWLWPLTALLARAVAAWYALMVALLALSVVALGIGLPDRRNL
jgi:hypothetical protein